jgi:hypothetical protein
MTFNDNRMNVAATAIGHGHGHINRSSVIYATADSAICSLLGPLFQLPFFAEHHQRSLERAHVAQRRRLCPGSVAVTRNHASPLAFKLERFLQLTWFLEVGAFVENTKLVESGGQWTNTWFFRFIH